MAGIFVLAAVEGWTRGFRGQCQERLAGTAVSCCLIIYLAVVHWDPGVWHPLGLAATEATRADKTE